MHHFDKMRPFKEYVFLMHPGVKNVTTPNLLFVVVGATCKLTCLFEIDLSLINTRKKFKENPIAVISS